MSAHPRRYGMKQVIPPGIIPSRYQDRIFDFVSNGKGDGMVSAVAGAGKTSTLLIAARLVSLVGGSQLRAQFVAFNRHTVAHLRTHLSGTAMSARTIHSLGFQCLKGQLGGKVVINEKKYHRLTKTWLEEEIRLHDLGNARSDQRAIVAALAKLLTFVRATLTPPDDPEVLQGLAAHFSLSLPNPFLPAIPEILAQGENQALEKHIIDFTDMLWLPFRWKLQPPVMDFLFVDEAQDLNPAQLDLLLHCRAAGGRMLFAGDPFQAIFGFAGADTRSYGNIQERTGATELLLPVCYRLPYSHVTIAQKLVPHIQSKEGAQEGVIEHCPERDLAKYVRPGDLVLCRLTAPLVAWCIRLVQSGIQARVCGIEIGNDLVQIVRQISRANQFELRRFLHYLDQYEDEQASRLMRLEHSAGRLQTLQDKCQALRECFQSMNPTSLEYFCQSISDLFSEGRSTVLFSTIHRAKGLENDTVLILCPDKVPLEWPDQQEWEWEQELNLFYVAVTRARQRLVILQPDGATVDYVGDYINERIRRRRTKRDLQARTGDWR